MIFLTATLYAQGEIGVMGPKGAMGLQGPRGANGLPGVTGDPGQPVCIIKDQFATFF